MSMMDFTQSPSYQRMMQKLHTIRPEQRAVLNSLSMDEKFADEATRRNLAAIAQRNKTAYRDKAYDANKAYADKALDFRAGAANRSLGLRREAFESEQDQDRMATGLGIGQVLAEADYGRQRDAIDLETFKEKKKLSDRLKQYYGGGAS